MTITVQTLDEGVKDELRTVIMRKLLRAYGTLPLSSEQQKILDVVNDGGVVEHLEDIITKYYDDLSVKDVKINLQPIEFVQIYLHYA